MNLILLIPLVGVVLFIVYFFYLFFIKIYIDGYKFKRMYPNLKLFITPFTGLIGLQKKCLQKYGDTHYFVKQMIKEDPQLKAYMTNLGCRPFIIFCDPKLIKQIHTNPKYFKKLNLWKHIDKIYSQGIFLVNDKVWKDERRLLSHSFSHDALKRLIPIMCSSVQAFVDRQLTNIDKTQNKKKKFKVLHQTQMLIDEILLRSFFSEDATTRKCGDQNLSMALAQLSVAIFDRARSGVNILATEIFGQRTKSINFTKKDKELQKAIDSIRLALFQLIDGRIANFENDTENDFMHHYISQMKKVDKLIAEAQAKGQKHQYRRITRQQIFHQLTTFCFAGIDTSGHLLAFAIYCLAQYPQYKKRILQEINNIMPRRSDITYQKLQKLQFLGKYLDQCLRLWPPAVGILARVTRQRIQIGPFDIPKDTVVGTNIIGLMHNQKYYKNPCEFNPDRFQPNAPHLVQPYAYIPFSAGQRSCIGKFLALMEAKIIMVYFLRNFDIERSDVPLRLQAKFLYQPVDDQLVIISKGGSPWTEE